MGLTLYTAGRVGLKTTPQKNALKVARSVKISKLLNIQLSDRETIIVYSADSFESALMGGN